MRDQRRPQLSYHYTMPLRLEAEFRAFAAKPTDPVDGALLISSLIHPTTDIAWCRAELARLAVHCGNSPRTSDVLQTLRIAGFSGAQDYYNRENSALELVLRRQRGIPISLAMVVIGVARQRGMQANGINFPNHFLVQLEDQVVDPFTLELLDADALNQRVQATGLSSAQVLRPASALDIVSRMLNNLRALATQQRDFQHALELTDYQMLLTPNSYLVHLARAELWHASEVPAMVREALQLARDSAPSAALKAEIEASLSSFHAPRPTLH